MLSSLLDWPLNLKSKCLTYSTMCLHDMQLWDSVYSQRICDCFREGNVFCLHPEAQEQENRDHLSLTYLMVLQPVGVSALLSLGFPLEFLTEFWNCGFRFMSTISSEVNTILTDFCILFYNINRTHWQSYLKCEFCYV